MTDQQPRRKKQPTANQFRAKIAILERQVEELEMAYRIQRRHIGKMRGTFFGRVAGYFRRLRYRLDTRRIQT